MGGEVPSFSVQWTKNCSICFSILVLCRMDVKVNMEVHFVSFIETES